MADNKPWQADKLRAKRAEYRITLYELSEELDVSVPLLSMYLNERARMPEGMGQRLRDAIEKLASRGVTR
jgi:transcriptional regulator with XRE-family HTH domain